MLLSRPVPAGLLRFPVPVLASVLASVLFTALAGPLPAAHPADEAAAADATPPDEDNSSATRGEELFAHRVLPIFREKCFACHGDDPDDIRGAFRMLTREDLLQGGDSGEAAIVPGNPDDSPLVQAIRWESYEMPPKENDRLTDDQIANVEQWVRLGAPWPDADRIAALLAADDDRWNAADGVTVATSGGLSPEWTNRRYEPENLWSWQPLWQDTSGRLTSGSRNPVDILIDDGLQNRGLTAAPPADRRTLIRRVTFDLIGLPPRPADIDDFVNDPDDDLTAFRRVVDRLLESPHYGEQWARHWLDVVRYADSSGYANDYERGNAWRYRDYVVRSFNDDKPYDEFVREQIAGDEIDPDDPELLIAAGFLRMGPWELTGMEVPKVARQRFLDDVTDAVGQVFLAHMLQCARCHDHKFDPVPTRDYYALQAVFATTQLATRPAEFLESENCAGFDEEEQYLRQRRRFYQDSLRDVNSRITRDAALEWYAEQGIDPQPFHDAVAELRGQGEPDDNISVSRIRRMMAEKKVDPAVIPPRHVGFEPQDFGLERVCRKGIERLEWQLTRYRPVAFSVYSGHTPQLRRVNAPLQMPDDPLADGDLEQTCILIGGDPFSPADPVRPGVLTAAADSGDASLDASVQGRRLELADWIASPENPLTARVMANRIWLWHFGQAIAGNPNNFGTTGKKPTHPELLDFLAGQLIANDWSVKSMHRLILLSETWRRSSSHPAPGELNAADPNRTSYAVFPVRRLEAEEIRDAMLAASGELNRTIGGIPVRPEINREAALQPRMVMGTFAEAWQPSPRPEQRHRRSLYALKIRGLRDPFMEVFNAPAPDLSCEARDESTVTPQVFALFNSEITFDRALALAHRVAAEVAKQNADTSEWTPAAPFPIRPNHITRIFRLTCGRRPTAEEVEACIRHWEQMRARHQGLTFELPPWPNEVVREAVEENTGEKFTFSEPLEFCRDFVPDLKPRDASPELRALAEICLVVLNSNEFVWVY